MPTPNQRLHNFLHAYHHKVADALHGAGSPESYTSDEVWRHSHQEAQKMGLTWHRAADKLNKVAGKEVRGSVVGGGNNYDRCLACGNLWEEPAGTWSDPHEDLRNGIYDKAKNQ